MTAVADLYKNYINGAWVEGGAGTIAVDNPNNGEALSQQAAADAADVDRAVQAAQAVHDSGTLSDLRPVERARMIQKMSAYISANKDRVASLLTLESGKPLWEAEIEVDSAARFLEFYGNQAESLEGRSIPLGASYFDFTTFEPYGVSGQIIPWNFPLEITARGIGPALATGNAVVVKTPEIDPLSHFIFGEAAEAAGFPAGAVNILCGHGAEAGAALTAHPDVSQIVFTGSVATGTAVAVAAAQRVVPCVLELGGKSAGIVYPDADPQQVLDSIRWGLYFNAGQVCSAFSRMVVHESIHDEMVERVADMAKGVSVGPGLERPTFGANMGAMVSEGQRDRAEAICQRAEAEGARAVTGGRKLNQPGYFLEPTVFDGVTEVMNIAQEEVFGPVLSVMKFSSDEEALRIANGTEYGLVAGVFTRDLDRATAAAQKLRAGQIYVNEWFAGGVETPFGGFGKSGYGREKGREALYNYVQTKNIGIALG